MSFFAHTLRNVASRIDFASASSAPLDTDGARPKTHVAETRVTQIQELIAKPAFGPRDLPAYWDAFKHANSIGLDDRKMLLEKLLVLMSRLKDHPASLKIQQLVINLLYKDLPHPPTGFLSPLEISRITHPTFDRAGDTHAPGMYEHPKMPDRVYYAYRAADGSNYNPLIPGLGKAGSPYARSVPSTNITPITTLPDPNLVFDTLLKRDKFTPHPDGISSLFFAFADLVIHSIFNTNHQDWSINDASSYLDLSILYGSSDKELSTVRLDDGTGRLIDDCFADGRLLLMPPASCALLILLNRNHNYIAQKILAINERGRFKDPSTLSGDAKRQQDDEIFHRTRLVNCGYFMHIILGDYVGTILGLARDGSDWRLDPLMPIRDITHDLTPRGEGNVVSIEFNLLYRWHSTISESNEQWLEKKFSKFFPKGANAAQIDTFKKDVDQLRTQRKTMKPSEWTFGELERVDGRFRDADLADIIQKATCDIAGAYKARGTPACMKVIEVMGMMQARAWGTCSLNEFRKFIGLKPYSTFKEWNPDPKIHKAAAALYKDIDKLELHVGLQAEEAKTPQAGAGLCPGYTISRAILADAVCLTRGDRFLTTDFTPFNLTAWGYHDCQYDKEDGSYGGLLTKLLFRTLPDQYPAGSVLAHFPFRVPQNMYETLKKRDDGSAEKYLWPVQLGDGKTLNLSESDKHLPPLERRAWKVVDSPQGVKQVLTSGSNFISKVDERLETVVEPVLSRKWGNKSGEIYKTIEKKQAEATEAIVSRENWREYFKKETESLLKEKAFDQEGPGNDYFVDVVKDVINLLPVRWICDKIAALPLKSANHRHGAWYEQEVFDQFADIARYVYMNFDPVDDFKLRERSQATATRVIDCIKDNLDDGDSHFGTLADVFEYIKVANRSESVKFLNVVRNKVGWEGSHAKLAVNVFNATVPTAALFSKAVAQVVDFYLDEPNKQAREEIVKLFLISDKDKDASAKIMVYVREALRLNPIFAGVYRTATGKTSISNSQVIDVGDWVFVDVEKANMSFGQTPDYSRPAEKQGILSPYQSGMLTPTFFDSVVPGIVGTILSQERLNRAEGEDGKLTQFDEIWHGTRRRRYVNTSGLVTPWPDAMQVGFMPKGAE